MLRRIKSWIDWAHASPKDPLDFVVDATLTMSPNPPDQGSYVNSKTFISAPAPAPVLKITAMRVITSGSGIVLAYLTNPPATLVLSSLNLPDTIELDFNFAPNPATINNATFQIIGMAGGLIGGSVVNLPTATTARLVVPAPLIPGTYIVQLNGTTIPTAQLAGTPLDGKLLALPTGTGVPGGDFVIGVDVVGIPIPPPSAPPAIPSASYWETSIISLASSPICKALRTDDMELVANASQWNASHSAANLDPTISPPLENVVFLRGGERWQMVIPLNLGYRSYTNLQLSCLYNGGTRGDKHGDTPAIEFAARPYTGDVTLNVTLRRLGVFIMGLRAIDSNGFWSMYEQVWNVER